MIKFSAIDAFYNKVLSKTAAMVDDNTAINIESLSEEVDAIVENMIEKRYISTADMSRASEISEYFVSAYEKYRNDDEALGYLDSLGLNLQNLAGLLPVLQNISSIAVPDAMGRIPLDDSSMQRATGFFYSDVGEKSETEDRVEAERRKDAATGELVQEFHEEIVKNETLFGETSVLRELASEGSSSRIMMADVIRDEDKRKRALEATERIGELSSSILFDWLSEDPIGSKEIVELSDLLDKVLSGRDKNGKITDVVMSNRIKETEPQLVAFAATLSELISSSKYLSVVSNMRKMMDGLMDIKILLFEARKFFDDQERESHLPEDERAFLEISRTTKDLSEDLRAALTMKDEQKDDRDVRVGGAMRSIKEFVSGLDRSFIEQMAKRKGRDAELEQLEILVGLLNRYKGDSRSILESAYVFDGLFRRSQSREEINNAYERLGIVVGTEISEIDSTYKALALENHPDRHQIIDQENGVIGIDPEYEKAFVEIVDAYEIVMKEELRRRDGDLLSEIYSQLFALRKGLFKFKMPTRIFGVSPMFFEGKEKMSNFDESVRKMEKAYQGIDDSPDEAIDAMMNEFQRIQENIAGEFSVSQNTPITRMFGDSEKAFVAANDLVHPWLEAETVSPEVTLERRKRKSKEQSGMQLVDDEQAELLGLPQLPQNAVRFKSETSTIPVTFYLDVPGYGVPSEAKREGTVLKPAFTEDTGERTIDGEKIIRYLFRNPYSKTDTIEKTLVQRDLRHQKYLTDVDKQRRIERQKAIEGA